MKTIVAASLALFFAVFAVCGQTQAGRMVPTPKSVKMDINQQVRLTDKMTVKFFCAEAKDTDAAKDFLRRKMKEWFDVRPGITKAAAEKFITPGGYRINVQTDAVSITATDLAGARHALCTLRQVADPVPGTARLTGYQVPVMQVEDAPSLAWRGIHLCWFPEYTATDMERYIRLAAYYKMNYVVLESWGMFKSKQYPFLAWKDSPMTISEVRRLAAIAKDLGVTLIPQINLFGHASGSRGSCGKHATLDMHPEMQPLFEPLGWNWCLSNPATRETLEKLVLEMHDAYGRPPFFHIGCDEADAPTCALCRKSDYHGVVADFITHIHDVLAKRGCRAMMWHDMLIQHGDPRWQGMVVNGGPDAEKMLDKLPKDILICDWEYDYVRKDGDWPTMRYFQSKGFHVLACPWENRKVASSQNVFARKSNLDGMLVTTWHHIYQTHGRIFEDAAHETWEACSGAPVGRVSGMVFAQHLRQIGWDVPVSESRDTGWVNRQMPENTDTIKW